MMNITLGEHRRIHADMRTEAICIAVIERVASPKQRHAFLFDAKAYHPPPSFSDGIARPITEYGV